MTLTINSLSCRLLAAFAHFSNNMVYVCLALLALKMLQILKSSTENWGMFILMCIGLLFSITSNVSWSLMMKIYANKLCWIVNDENYFHWINHGVQFMMLIIAIFLVMRCAFFTEDKFERDIK